MKIDLKIIAMSLILGLAAPVQISSAQVSGDVHIRIAPPAPIHEVRGTRPDRGSIWVGGYHEYDPAASAYHWHAGRWDTPPRHGAKWIAPRYQHQGKEYKYTAGRWK